MLRLKYKKPFLCALFLFALFFIVGWSGLGIAFAGENHSFKNQINYYIKKYGPADPQADPLIERSYDIFRRVRAVADKRSTYLPKLKIINSRKEPWAIALPDGHIVLSVRTVEVCYQGVSRKQGDARMAFILGHELGHFAKEDSWHTQTYQALSNGSGLDRIRQDFETSGINSDDKWQVTRENPAQMRIKEVWADDRGFMYAGIAGFAVDTLVSSRFDDTDFFLHWVSQTQSSGEENTHPRPRDRSRFLQARLARLIQSLDYFKYGMRLAHFGKCSDAVYFFRQFQSVFPSREVYNNVGYCLLQQAFDQMPPEVAHRYWLPTAIDYRSRGQRLHLRGASEKQKVLLPGPAAALLGEAAAYFKMACDADVHYLPARLNLAAANYFLGRYFEARAAIEQALTLKPVTTKAEHTKALIMKALILIREDPSIDMWPISVKLLEDITTQENDNICALYNLAMLYEERGRSGKAQNVRSKLALKTDHLPAPMRKTLLTKMPKKTILEASSPPVIKPPWAQPLQIGTILEDGNKAEKLIADWVQMPFGWYGDAPQGRMLKNLHGHEILDLDGMVEMVVMTGPDLGTMDNLKKRLGEPVKIYESCSGRLIHYNDQWCILVTGGDKIQEVWIAGK